MKMERGGFSVLQIGLVLRACLIPELHPPYRPLAGLRAFAGLQMQSKHVLRGMDSHSDQGDDFGGSRGGGVTVTGKKQTTKKRKH